MLSKGSVVLASLLAVASAFPAPHNPAAKPIKTGKAIYFLSNNAENAVVAVPIGADGKLSGGVINPTGGKGGNSISSATNNTAGPDALASQAALTVAGMVRQSKMTCKKYSKFPMNSNS
jgi:hypothetical protein